MVQVYVDLEELGALGTGEGVLYGEVCIAQEPTQSIAGRRGHAAAVAAQIQYNVFDGAVFTGDLLMCIDDNSKRVVGQLSFLRQLVVIDSTLHVAFRDDKLIKGYIGGVAYFVIRQGRFGILCSDRCDLCADGIHAVHAESADCIRIGCRQIRGGKELGMTVVKPELRQVGNGLICFFCTLVCQFDAEIVLQEEGSESFDVM